TDGHPAAPEQPGFFLRCPGGKVAATTLFWWAGCRPRLNEKMDLSSLFVPSLNLSRNRRHSFCSAAQRSWRAGSRRPQRQSDAGRSMRRRWIRQWLGVILTNRVVNLDSGHHFSMNDVTRILSAIKQGDPAAAGELLPLVYNELRRLATAWL